MTTIDESLIQDKANLFAALDKITSRKWNVKRVNIVKLRKQLLVAQGYKCVYCRRPIVLDEVGHRDIDHILPKSKNPEKDFDLPTSQKNEYDHRRHTGGYADFMYRAKNLALTCKMCNATKGSFDPLFDRTIIPAALPTGKNAYKWVHPYYDTYGDHIRVLEGFVYQAITPEQGKYVISACGLDTLKGLTARILDAMLLNSKDFSRALVEVAYNTMDLDLRTAAERIYYHFEKLSEDVIEDFLRRLKPVSCLNDQIAILTDLRTALGTGDFIAAIK